MMDNLYRKTVAADGAETFTPFELVPSHRVLFASPVTGKVGDVWGHDAVGRKWFAAVSYGQHYETRPGVWAYHTGVDLNLPDYKDAGAPILAAADGNVVVSRAVGSGWQGIMVVIEHRLEDGSKIWTRYAHLRDTIPIGQTVVSVKRGDLIGLVGDYTPAGPPNDHCHYDTARIDLGAHPEDWPGNDMARVIRDYIDPVGLHTERSKQGADMGLIELLIIIVVLALVWWLLTAYLLPLLPQPWRNIVLVICVVITILFLLSLIGIGPGIRL